MARRIRLQADIFVRRFADELRADDARSVLDCGSGVGRNAFYLARRGFAVTALDVSRRQLLQGARGAAHRGLALASVQADIRRLPFADASFDGLVCTHVLESHTLPSIKQAAAEFTRLLRAGGRLLVMTVAAEGSELPEASADEPHTHYFGASGAELHIHFATEDEMVAWFPDFRVEELFHLRLARPVVRPIAAHWVLSAVKQG